MKTLVKENKITSKTAKSSDEIVVLSRESYDDFLRWQEQEAKRRWEEADTDEAVADYLEAKKNGKLKLLRSLKDLR